MPIAHEDPKEQFCPMIEKPECIHDIHVYSLLHRQKGIL